DAEGDGAALAVADDLKLDRLADFGVRRQALELAVVVDYGALERHHDVVLLKSGRRRRAPWIHARDDCPAGLAEPEWLRQLDGQGLRRDAGPAPPDLAAIDHLSRHALDSPP